MIRLKCSVCEKEIRITVDQYEKLNLMEKIFPTCSSECAIKSDKGK